MTFLASIFQRKANVTEDKEQQLIRGCIAWKREAQNELYRTFAAKMFAVCFRYSKSTEDAEDTFHEGFMKVFENIKAFKGSGSLEGWIRKVMVNTAIEKYRQNSHLSLVVSIEDTHENLNHFVSDDLLSGIEANELICMIQKLPPAYKMVFNLYVFEGLKHKEIAAQLRISEGTSKSNLSDAKAILRKKINAELSSFEQVINYNGR